MCIYLFSGSQELSIIMCTFDKDNDLFFRNAIKIIYKRYDI